MKAIRAFFGYSQQDVAELIGRSRAWVSEVENGKRIPPRDKQIELERILQTNEIIFQ